MCQLLAELLSASLLNLPFGLNFIFVVFSFLRAMQFNIIFLQEVLTGEPDLVKCAKKAYEGSLKRFHGWMVQGIFSVSSSFLKTFTPFDISDQPAPENS